LQKAESAKKTVFLPIYVSFSTKTGIFGGGCVTLQASESGFAAILTKQLTAFMQHSGSNSRLYK
jgi:hypothetical protein